MPWRGRLIAHMSPRAPGITLYGFGTRQPGRLFLSMMGMLIGSMPWRGHPMGLASLPRARIRRYRYGMPLQETRLSPTVAIPAGCTLWPGRPMGLASPLEAMTRPCRCGRQFDSHLSSQRLADKRFQGGVERLIRLICLSIDTLNFWPGLCTLHHPHLRFAGLQHRGIEAAGDAC